MSIRVYTLSRPPDTNEAGEKAVESRSAHRRTMHGSSMRFLFSYMQRRTIRDEMGFTFFVQKEKKLTS